MSGPDVSSYKNPQSAGKAENQHRGQLVTKLNNLLIRCSTSPEHCNRGNFLVEHPEIKWMKN